MGKIQFIYIILISLFLNCSENDTQVTGSCTGNYRSGGYSHKVCWELKDFSQGVDKDYSNDCEEFDLSKGFLRIFPGTWVDGGSCDTDFAASCERNRGDEGSAILYLYDVAMITKGETSICTSPHVYTRFKDEVLLTASSVQLDGKGHFCTHYTDMNGTIFTKLKNYETTYGETWTDSGTCETDSALYTCTGDNLSNGTEPTEEGTYNFIHYYYDAYNDEDEAAAKSRCEAGYREVPGGKGTWAKIGDPPV